MKNIKDIFLVRHGQTEWNRLQINQGCRNDTMINNTGIEQAIYTGKYFADYKLTDSPFDLVLCSPLKRTRQTANIICKIIGYDTNKIVYMPELIERDKGLISMGKSKKELRKDKFYDDYFKYHNIAKTTNALDDLLYNKYKYEPTSEMKKRLARVIEFLKNTDNKKILVISHGGTIRTLTYMMTGYTGKPDLRYGKNCSVTYLEHTNKFNLISPTNTRHFGIYGKNYL